MTLSTIVVLVAFGKSGGAGEVVGAGVDVLVGVGVGLGVGVPVPVGVGVGVGDGVDPPPSGGVIIMLPGSGIVISPRSNFLRHDDGIGDFLIRAEDDKTRLC